MAIRGEEEKVFLFFCLFPPSQSLKVQTHFNPPQSRKTAVVIQQVIYSQLNSFMFHQDLLNA